MSIRYRFKRSRFEYSSGPVHEPIQAHPDSFYRPIPHDDGPIVPRLLSNSPIAAAPLAAGGAGGFSPWWILGPLLALLAAMAVGALAYGIKKKQDKNDDDTNEKQQLPVEKKTMPLLSAAKGQY